ncbi:efflux RND transporter periplasmic adaptor subunit [Loktanella sp. M215]|uniref:efflux RND transporter periplasmic adaptor subunit n=1 Tax=Loktanella sp. M215 TaxID=2675431 RepID=UPI001F028744|nr:efflux RND transporter periplasmic adaptor subunit [Loktanella sp. M215]MCF7699116.1 efflux RND transporter periplasmic adaptor subunit [Loktanella sp. M215]
MRVSLSCRDRLWRACALVFAIYLTAQAAAADPLRVATVTAALESNARTLSMTGALVARDTVTAAFPTGGRVAEVLVEIGDSVAADTVLARVDQVQQQQALRAAQAGLVSAQASQRKARDDSERLDVLLDRGAATRSARDAAADGLRAADAQVAQAQAELDRATKALSDTELRAPAAATVTDRLIEPGQVIGAGQPVLEMAIGTRFDAIFDVPESLMTRPPVDPKVTLSPLARPTQTVTGGVREISPLVDPRTGTVRVSVAVDAPPPGLSYGDPVRGAITQPVAQLIVLPWTAMGVADGAPAVWVVDPADNSVTLQPVTVLRYESERIILSGGIAPGTTVVTAGTQFLYPGRIVEPLQNPKDAE